jgi:starch phosphorylase
MADEKERIFRNLPENISGLGEMAMNLWWVWPPSARRLFKMLDRQEWKESRHNAVKMLRELPAERLEAAARDPGYLRHYEAILAQYREEVGGEETFLSDHGLDPGTGPIAYFSAEYGLHHSLPFYAGGLGFLAGDFIKECSDLKIPVVAVGFMYPEGYFRQRIRDDGWQENLDEKLDREAASISRVLDGDGRQLVIQVPFIDPPIHIALWKIAVGRVPLYLIDTDIEINDPWNRRISQHLYTGDLEQRLRQEIVLGIGGYEVLRRIGVRPALLHLNEGHPAFAILERIRAAVGKGTSWDEAAGPLRKTTVFTTHTPVPAGHDVFPFSLMERYFHAYWPALGLDHDGFLRLGMHPENPAAGFNMTAFALRMSEHRNGVSRRHGRVARDMWQCLWPGTPEERVPIGHVTNGVHVPTWIEPKMELLFNKYLGGDWLARHDDPSRWEKVGDIPDEELWKTHFWLKVKLIDAVRERARNSWVKDHAGAGKVLAGGAFLDPTLLTVGFARRFASYKRGDLIFRDWERLKRLVNDRWRPVQIIFAGKAHPADDPGKRILQRVFRAAGNSELSGRIAFLEDYDEQFAQYLVHGVDVWLNNPLPPMEASGTSGMKASLNGVPNLSILDGWWMEGYNGKNGWAFGAGPMEGNRDDRDAGAIYDLLEREIVPLYYRVSEDGVPLDWVAVMKESIRSTAAAFSARRMVKEYTDKFYLPALRQNR